MTMTRPSTRQEVALELAFSAGEPLGREEVRDGPAEERGFVIALAEIECGMIEREFAALERWLGWLAGAPVADEFERARLVEDCQLIGWHLPAPPEAS